MKRVGTPVAVAVAALFMSACAGGGSGAERKSDGVLTFATVLAQSTLDPALMPIPQMSVYASPGYDSLTLLSPDEEVEPLLATEWTAGEDKQGPFLDMSLREGLEFEDGTPFTAATVVANVTRSQTLEGSTNAVSLAGVTVEEQAPSSVRFRNPAGVGALPRLLAGPAGMMISDKAIADKADLSTTTAGIGPYVVDSVQPNRVVYKANDQYWDQDAVGAKTLELRYLTDDAKLNAIRSGDLDVTLVPEQLLAATGNSGYDVQSFLGTENYMFVFNTQLAPFDDVRVRQAASMAFNRAEVCDNLLNGACEATGQFFGAGAKAYDPDASVDVFEFDLDRAKQLIDEAGAKGAKAEIVTVAGNQTFEQLAAILQAQLKAIGLDASVTSLAPPQVVSRFTSDKDAAIVFGAAGNNFDPSIDVARYLLEGSLYNVGHVSNPAIAKLAAEALKDSDQEARIAVYRNLSDEIAEDVLLMPMMTPESHYLVGPNVEGWELPWAPSFPSFRGVSG